MINLLIFVISVIFLYKWLNQKPRNFPPGLPTVPFLGSLPFIESNNFHMFLEKCREKYGPVIGMKFGTALAVCVCGPDEIFEVLKRDDFQARNNVISGGTIDNGIMFANGERWKNQRRFVIRHLRDFGFGKTTVADMVQQEFEEFCSKRLSGRDQVEVPGLFNICAINILWAMLGGTRHSYEDENFQKLLKRLEELFRTGNLAGGVVNTIPGLKKFISLFYELNDDKIQRLIREFFKEATEQHKKTMTDTPRDFIDVYLKELQQPKKHESFEEDTLYEVLRDFFSAGTESSSNTVSFAIMYLILYPEWQEKIFEEVDRVLGGRSPTYEDRHSLPMVEAFLNEVQRCNTIAPLAVPHATSKDAVLAGYFIPEGTLVHVNIWSLLQDKKHWGDPENFRPDRFFNEQGGCIKDPYMLLFGTGPRVCAGESLARNFVFLFFVSLIQRFQFSLPKGATPPSTVCKSGFTTAPQMFSAALKPRVKG